MALIALQVSQKELKQAIDWEGPAWPQLWQLLQKLTTNHQHLQHSDDPAEGQAGSTAAATMNAGAAGGLDTVQLFERYLAEADAVPLTPPPYPGVQRGPSQLSLPTAGWQPCSGSPQFRLLSAAEQHVAYSPTYFMFVHICSCCSIAEAALVISNRWLHMLSNKCVVCGPAAALLIWCRCQKIVAMGAANHAACWVWDDSAAC